MAALRGWELLGCQTGTWPQTLTRDATSFRDYPACMNDGVSDQWPSSVFPPGTRRIFK
jgi:hypothetical protein